MKPILEVRNIAKKYAIGQNERYLALRDVLANPVRAIRARAEQKREASEFWALQDISFDIYPGDSVGIIGRNGAGKSTLLKILSKITPPTRGSITCRGRVASLLEVGTGFHPELTGRENIYLNGSILGLRKWEIDKHFDAIVDFSGVEKFLDTPLKRYSSGMQLRLAFAVAAHLEPEILVIDEVLAVGDAEFQKKCLGKMSEVSRSGRTVLFVSHDMNSIKQLCTSAILLNKGQIDQVGSTPELIRRYLSKHLVSANHWKNTVKKTGVFFEKISVQLKGEQPNHYLKVDFSIASDNQYPEAFVAFDVVSALGTPVLQAIPNLKPFIVFSDQHTIQNFCCEIELNGLIPGTYFVTAWIGSHNTETYDLRSEILSFELLESPQKGRTFAHSADHGFIVPTSKLLNTSLN